MWQNFVPILLEHFVQHKSLIFEERQTCLHFSLYIILPHIVIVNVRGKEIPTAKAKLPVDIKYNYKKCIFANGEKNFQLLHY